MSIRDEVPSLRSVIQRFEESSASLDHLNEAVLALGISQDEQAMQVASIRRLSEQGVEFIAQIGEASAVAREALDRIKTALEAASQFVEGTDLKALQAAVQRTEEAVDSAQKAQVPMFDRLSAEIQQIRDEQAAMAASAAEATNATRAGILQVGSDLSRAIESLNGRLVAAESAAAEEVERRRAAERELGALNTRITAIPEKTRNKLGL